MYTILFTQEKKCNQFFHYLQRCFGTLARSIYSLDRDVFFYFFCCRCTLFLLLSSCFVLFILWFFKRSFVWFVAIFFVTTFCTFSSFSVHKERFLSLYCCIAPYWIQLLALTIENTVTTISSIACDYMAQAFHHCLIMHFPSSFSIIISFFFHFNIIIIISIIIQWWHRYLSLSLTTVCVCGYAHFRLIFLKIWYAHWKHTNRWKLKWKSQSLLCAMIFDGRNNRQCEKKLKSQKEKNEKRSANKCLKTF